MTLEDACKRIDTLESKYIEMYDRFEYIMKQMILDTKVSRYLQSTKYEGNIFRLSSCNRTPITTALSYIDSLGLVVIDMDKGLYTTKLIPDIEPKQYIGTKIFAMLTLDYINVYDKIKSEISDKSTYTAIQKVMRSHKIMR